MAVTACQAPEPVQSGNRVVILPEGALELMDTQFGMYYGNINNDGVGVMSLVLSDALCYQDDLDRPYLDSEGDMLVLQLRIPLLADDQDMVLSAGEYPVSGTGEVNTVYAPASYVKRLTGNMQTQWNLSSGSIIVACDQEGQYTITTADLVIAKGDVSETVEYVCNSSIRISDYLTTAPEMTSSTDDIIDMPFTDVDCVYYGDLFGYGTGNFVVTMSTKGFVNADGEMTDVAGIYLTLNFFSRLYSGNSSPVLEEGRYTVTTTTSSSLFQRWTLLPGLLMDSVPFGSYILQQTADGEGVVEYVSSGVIDVKYDASAEAVAKGGKLLILTYDLKTSSRSIVGEWQGEIVVDNQSTDTASSYLTTLDHDVDCDMSKVTGGTLHLIETLHRDNVVEEWDYDIAEAWQLYLQPRDWTAEEYDIPWLQDDNANGIPDRLEAYCADGDVMVLEFVLPLGSEGQIAPEKGKTYTYTMQPDLSIEDELYEIYVSRMGRPYDEIFDSYYAQQYPGWAEYLDLTSYDRCNARRGFTWSEDGWRGNWYLHYETGRHFIMDEYAPAINGWVKVTRTGEDIYDFEWDLIDDNPGTPNVITGSIKDCKVNIQLN